jgi:HEAT repeats
MKRIICLSALALLGLANYASAWGGGFACFNWGIHCVEPPCPSCPDCSNPCDRGLHFTLFGAEHAHKLIDQLGGACCCDRIKAAENLGSRIHADFCCVPEVLVALTNVLANDPCWEVRKAAAWSIARQKARTEEGVMALYLASKLDPHFLVRDAATDALSVLLVCRQECFKDLFAHGDELVKALRGQYRPGQGVATVAPARPEELKSGEPQPPAEPLKPPQPGK